MNFTINTEVLLKNINDVSRAVSNKVQMPGLTGIKFNINKNYILLTANNNEIAIQSKILEGFTVIDEGEFILQGKYLLEIVKKISTANVDFMSFESNSIKLIAGKSVFTLNEIQLDSFPTISFEEADLKFCINSINLKQIIRKTSFSASTNESRIVLTGVSFIAKDKMLEVVASDSYRLSRKQIFFENSFPEIKIIIPSRSLDELNKIIDESEENIEINCTSTKAMFKYRNIFFQTRLIDGVFPNISLLIPTKTINKLKFNKNGLISTIDRVSVFVNNEVSNIIKLTINSNKTVEFAAVSNEFGAANEEVIPLECEEGCNFQIAFSSKYFLDALKSFDSEEIYISFTGEIKPFIITSDYDKHLIQLILPVRA